MIRSEKGGGWLGLILAIVFLFGCVILLSQPCFWGPASCAAANGTVSASPTQPIEMIQPQGFPQRDQQNAQTNLTNATAEDMRAAAAIKYAEAKRIETLAPAEAAVLYAEVEVLLAEARNLDAQSCDTRNDCGLYSYLSGEKDGFKQGQNDVLIKIVGGIVVVVLLFIAFARR